MGSLLVLLTRGNFIVFQTVEEAPSSLICSLRTTACCFAKQPKLNAKKSMRCWKHMHKPQVNKLTM